MPKCIRRKELTKKDIAGAISMGSDIYSGKFNELMKRKRKSLEKTYTSIYGRKFCH